VSAAALGNDEVDVSAAALGNDVVDLRDADARRLHPRFDARAFAPGERVWIGEGPGAGRRRWSLWAAKEAAHKALRQEAPGLGFAPGHYRVRLGPDGRGTVRRGDRRIAVRVEADGERVHAVAFRGAEAGLCVEVARAAALDPDDPSRAVRRLLARSLDGVAFELTREDRIPRLRLAGRDVAVSFSHHGRFVAFARRDGGATPDAAGGGGR
jgi:hypothetical protein